MIKLENVQVQQAGKSTLSQICSILPNFPFHGKTSKRININPTSSLQAYTISQMRAVMSRLGNSLLQQAREKDISVTLSHLFHFVPCAIKGRWQVGCGISVSLDDACGKSTLLAQDLSVHL